ncbi:MAG: hypothetical protein VW405_21765, partial [Rhodospirillaceae bacterium]
MRLFGLGYGVNRDGAPAFETQAPPEERVEGTMRQTSSGPAVTPHPTIAIRTLAAALLAVLAIAPHAAAAQATPSVYVDLGALNDGGRGPMGGAEGLALPPATAPMSTLHVAPKAPVKMR